MTKREFLEKIEKTGDLDTEMEAADVDGDLFSIIDMGYEAPIQRLMIYLEKEI